MQWDITVIMSVSNNIHFKLYNEIDVIWGYNGICKSIQCSSILHFPNSIYALMSNRCNSQDDITDLLNKLYYEAIHSIV